MQISQNSLLIKKKLEKADSIAIFWHQNPDWDAIWSMYWLWRQLAKLWKSISYFTPDQPSPLFDFLDISDLKTEFDYANYDLLILVDMNHPIRMKRFYEGHENYFNQADKVIIDHHLADQNYPIINATIFTDHTAIANCELVYELTLSRRWDILFDERIATLLYMWIATDSGNFRHDEKHQTIRLMEDALWTLKLWADKQGVINNFFSGKTVEELDFIQHILSRLSHTWDIYYSRYTKEELETSWLHRDSADSALYLMKDVKAAQLIILWKEIEDWIRISIRWKWKYNTSKLASHFGWWWHLNASGCTIPFTWDMKQDMEGFIQDIIILVEKE